MRMKEMRVLGILGFLGLTPVPVIAQVNSAPILRDAPSEYLFRSNNIVLAMPDIGGYYINQQPIKALDLLPQLQAIYSPRPARERVLLISLGLERSARNLKYVIAIADRFGIKVYRLTKDVAL